MRIMTVVFIGMLSACVALPATAQKKSANPQASAATPTWEECHDSALKHGLADLQKGSAEFMKDCQAGRIPGVSRASVRLVRGSFEQCEERAATLALQHGQAGHIEFVRECMGGRATSPSSQRR